MGLSRFVPKWGQALFVPVGVRPMWYIFWFLIGFGLSVTGGITIIAYMNFLPAGVTWLDYFSFISTRMECYLLPIGILIMFFVLKMYPNNK